MIFCQWLVAANNLMEIGVHQLIYNVHVVEVLPRGRPDDVANCHDVLMVHVPQELDFSQSSLGIDSVVECVADLLDRNFFPCFGIHSGAVQNALVQVSNANQLLRKSGRLNVTAMAKIRKASEKLQFGPTKLHLRRNPSLIEDSTP